MARILIEDGQLVVRLTGLEPLLALRRTIRVPLAHVAAVMARPPEAAVPPARQGYTYRRGTSLPGLGSAGAFLRPGEGWSFFLVFDPARTIAVDLVDEPYARLVVQVGDEPPEAAARRIEAAVSGRDP